MSYSTAPSGRDLEPLHKSYWNACANLAWARVEERETALPDALARSYLMTMRATAEGRVPGKSLTTGFTATNDEGRYDIYFRGSRIPIASELIREHLVDLGSDLRCGEWIILDAALVCAVMKKAIGWSNDRSLNKFLAATHDVLARRKRRSLAS